VNSSNKISFHPFFVVKDVLGILVFCLLFWYTLFLFPDHIIDPTNNIPANPLVTPTHIVPE
jgi:quinol-cytochrome oxidoreductase complex cytochrome b subunit